MMQMIWEKSIAVSFLILIVCVVRMVGRGKIRSSLIYGLWGLVALRLLWPATLMLPSSKFSIQNLVTTQEIFREYTEEDALPEYVPNVLRGDALENEMVEPSGQSAQQDSWLQQNQSMQTGQENNVHSMEGENGRQDRAVKLSSLGVIWISGSLLMLAVVGITQLRFFGSLKKERILWTAAGSVLHWSKEKLPVYLWKKAKSPFLYGALRPSVYVTEECIKNEKERHYVLLHEYCHFQHGDHVWALVRLLCLVLYWYHPLVWLAAYLSRIDCELACDDSVRARLGEHQRLDYANALMAVLEAGMHSRRLCDMTTSMSGAGKEISQRLTLLWKKRPGRVLTTVMAGVLIVSLSMMTFTGPSADKSLAGEPDQKESETLENSVVVEDAGSSAEDPIIVVAGQRLLEGVYYQCDLDGNDDQEVFCYHGMDQDMTGTFEIDGEIFEITEGLFEGSKFQTTEINAESKESRQVYYLTDIREGDGQLEFALLGTSKELYAETAWLVFDGSSMIFIGKVEGWPFAEESYWTLTSEMEAKLRDGIWGLDGQGHIGTYRKLWLITEMWTDVIWELDAATGLLQCTTSERGFYTCSSSRYFPVSGGGHKMGYDHTFYLRFSLALYCEPDLGAETFVMTSDPMDMKPVTLTHTDDKNWVRIKNENGESGWIYVVEKSEEGWENNWNGTLLTPDGEKEIRHYFQDRYESPYAETDSAEKNK